MAIAAISTVVEWYDFTLYLYFATVLSRVFFGGGEGLAGRHPGRLCARLSAAAAGRDRVRLYRRSLTAGARIMLASVARDDHRHAGHRAVAHPCRHRAGAPGWLLLALRCVMGFSVGGEYAVWSPICWKARPTNRRGLIASLASAASEVGGCWPWVLPP